MVVDDAAVLSIDSTHDGATRVLAYVRLDA